MTTPTTLSDERLRYLADHPASALVAPAPFGSDGTHRLRQSELEALAREALAARSLPEGVPTHRHVKRGTEYTLIAYGHWTGINQVVEDGADLSVREDAPGLWSACEQYERESGQWASLQTGKPMALGDVVAIYRSVDDDSLWVRPREEFEDGRFITLPRLAANTPSPEGVGTMEGVAFQYRVAPWMRACFGPEISNDRLERGDRALEEMLEMLQSGDYPRERVAALTEYVYSRPKGDPHQEVGGVMVTLAAYCLAHNLDMHAAGEDELARINTPETIAKIRAKQAAKPTGSALPVAIAAPAQPVTVKGEPVAHMTEQDALWLDAKGTVDCRLYRLPMGSRWTVPLYRASPIQDGTAATREEVIEECAKVAEAESEAQALSHKEAIELTDPARRLGKRIAKAIRALSLAGRSK